MAVGTGAISLSEVIAEMAGTQTSLQDCIDDHKPAGLNSTYYTAPLDSLADFRGYSHSSACNTTTSLNIGSIAYSSTGLACSGTYSETLKYYLGTGANVENGGTVYTDSAGCNVFNGGNNYYKVRSNTSGFFTIRISTLGIVSIKTTCLVIV